MESLPKLNGYRTLCALPNELLHEIMTAVGDSQWIKPCTLVCSCLRPVCQEVLFKRRRLLRVEEDKSFDHFFSFINSLNITLDIVRLILCSKEGAPSTIDAASVARIVEKFPQLRTLSINACIKATNASAISSDPTPSSSLITQPSRPTLEDLEISPYTEHQSSLAETLRIVSLFEVDTLCVGGSFDLATAPIRSRVSLPLRARFIEAHMWYPSMTHQTKMLSALALHLETGYLQELHVEISCRDSVRALGRLLSGPASQIVALALATPDPPPDATMKELQNWKDPLDQHWSLLNFSACTRLETFSLTVIMRLKSAAFPLCTTLAELMTQVSKTLKKVTIYVDDIQKAEVLSNSRLMNLQALDKVLSDPDKSPRFENLKLYLHLCPDACVDRGRFREKAIARCEKALRNLHSSGRLTLDSNE
ncbi:hypothetical protein C8Q74DRAFT_206645 [Fomes fomentarius]|nr:hypothetical protein C8Q74DRAFT_206645 [Fomes fomentarius]